MALQLHALIGRPHATVCDDQSDNCSSTDSEIMMRTRLCVLAALTLFCSLGYAADGLISLQSDHDVDTTADRLEKILREKGLTIFARIDHAKSAQKAGMELRPTTLVIFGNPKIGTSLMQCQQSIAIDLPQKVLIWKDESGQVWLSFNDPRHLAARHGVENCEKTIAQMSRALRNFAQSATAKQQ